MNKLDTIMSYFWQVALWIGGFLTFVLTVIYKTPEIPSLVSSFIITACFALSFLVGQIRGMRRK